MIDMLCHWRYLVDNVFGSIKSISCGGATHVAERMDEQGIPYKCTADDSCYATMELENGILCQFNVLGQYGFAGMISLSCRWMEVKVPQWSGCVSVARSLFRILLDRYGIRCRPTHRFL